jgi:hypothetical protein
MKNSRMHREAPRARGNISFMPTALAWAVCSVLFIATGVLPAVARDVQRENALKAGYLFNFIKFVEWPPLVDGDVFTLCFMGADGVHDELAAVLPEKRLGGRHLAPRRLAPNESPVGCQVLYVDSELMAATAKTINARTPALLTVSDASDFLRSGGIIELFAEGNRLRFRVNLENAKRAHLRISSSLLRLASSVEKEAES